MIMLRKSIQSAVLFLFLFQLAVTQKSDNASISNTAGTSVTSTNAPQSSTVPSKSNDEHSKAISTESSQRKSTSVKAHMTQTQSNHPTILPSTPNNASPKNGSVSDIDLLPIRPEITPAFGVGGFILMVSGLAYTLVGMRKRWLSIFLSSGYLVALAVTVLVLYVCDPPVSDAIQGAYLVAAVAAGCIIGGLSLIFTEVTEGLGCLLGGFCLAMWFLVLKPGGLVTSTGGRVGMIAGFSVASYGFAFSKYTRTYGLMFSIAFAGATVVILGIDCFSRAGLKEFWVYIWSLNDNLFPLYTTTYPMTRGIKVEIAGIIILFLCGLLSQWKLYKILKERKEKKAMARAQDDEAREHLEADVGRRIEDTNARERALWERQYGIFGEKDHASAAGSVVGSTYPPTSDSRPQSAKDMTMSSREVGSPDAEVMEMKTLMPGQMNSRASLMSKSNENGLTYSVRSIYDEPMMNSNNMNNNELDRISEVDSRAPSMSGSPPQWQRFESASLRPSAPPPPVIVPLPFTVTEEETRIREDDDGTESVATAGNTAVNPVESRGKGKSTKKSIVQVESREDEDEDSVIYVPHVEDDRASSVAATLDDLTDDEDGASLPPISRPASPTRRSVRQVSKKPSLRRVGSASDLYSKEPSLPDSAISEVKTKRRLSEPPPSDLTQILFNEPGPKQPEDLSNLLDLSTAKASKRKSVDSQGRTSVSGSQSVVVSLSAIKNIRLPSVAAQKYRTHEWTKYLSDAEQPLPGELDPSEDGVRIERYSRESAAPVRVEELQQTAAGSINGAAAHGSTNNSRNSAVQGLSRSFSDQPVLQQQQSHMSQSFVNPQPTRSLSQPTIMTQSRNLSSNLISQPLVESPIEDVPDSSTLLGQRESILRKKASMNNLHRIRSVNSNPNFAGSTFFPNQMSTFSETSSIRSFAPTARVDPDSISLASLKQKMDEDNMPLSRRKTLIQQQVNQGQTPYQVHRLSGGSTQSQAFQPQSQSTWPDQSIQHQSLIYDAHLPQRGPSLDAYTRQARMASFRESLRHGLGPNSTPAQAAAGNEGHRFAMLTEKRQVQAQLQQKEYQKQVLDNVVDQGMRNGVMLDLHKERLRQMQSQASSSAR